MRSHPYEPSKNWEMRLNNFFFVEPWDYSESHNFSTSSLSMAFDVWVHPGHNFALGIDMFHLWNQMQQDSDMNVVDNVHCAPTVWNQIWLYPHLHTDDKNLTTFKGVLRQLRYLLTVDDPSLKLECINLYIKLWSTLQRPVYIQQFTWTSPNLTYKLWRRLKKLLHLFAWGCQPYSHNTSPTHLCMPHCTRTRKAVGIPHESGGQCKLRETKLVNPSLYIQTIEPE